MFLLAQSSNNMACYTATRATREARIFLEKAPLTLRIMSTFLHVTMTAALGSPNCPSVITTVFIDPI